MELKDKKLAGADVGLQAYIDDKISVSVAIGFSLKREINEEEQSKSRLHVSFTGRF